MAGCGRGADAAQVSESQKVAWREQSRRWISADLDRYELNLKSDAGRKDARQGLDQLLAAPDLAPVRDPAAVSLLPAAEREAWRELWKRVGNLRDRTPVAGRQ